LRSEWGGALQSSEKTSRAGLYIQAFLQILQKNRVLSLVLQYPLGMDTNKIL
jgi:hypothetical protein